MILAQQMWIMDPILDYIQKLLLNSKKRFKRQFYTLEIFPYVKIRNRVYVWCWNAHDLDTSYDSTIVWW